MPKRVIELDGPQTWSVRYRAESGVLFLDPTTGVPGNVLLRDSTGHCGSLTLKPDPVRAAEIAERERCRQCVADEMDKATAAHDCPSAHKLGKAIAAIDASAAPPEPSEAVREFVRGHRAGQEQMRGRVPCRFADKLEIEEPPA